jgi:2-polyprenyl-3-methyl-5-hydroxy-6-metoxy-1,4-benzoquinol methylase
MQAAEEQDKVVRFYDQFAEKQEKTGINSRHLSILDKVKQAGLQAQHRILEVGCGIGTVSHLLATQVPQGEVLAVDISPESIEKARVLWKKQGNLKFDVSDMSDFNLPGKTFDFFVFPDVLEHIPVAQHAPRYLEWMIANQPEKLQVIDQPLDTGILVQTLGAAGFYLEKMETYALFFEEKDYQYFVFRSSKKLQQSTAKSKWQVLKERVLIRLKYGITS